MPDAATPATNTELAAWEVFALFVAGRTSAAATVRRLFTRIRQEQELRARAEGEQNEILACWDWARVIVDSTIEAGKAQEERLMEAEGERDAWRADAVALAGCVPELTGDTEWEQRVRAVLASHRALVAKEGGR